MVTALAILALLQGAGLVANGTSTVPDDPLAPTASFDVKRVAVIRWLEERLSKVEQEVAKTPGYAFIKMAKLEARKKSLSKYLEQARAGDQAVISRVLKQMRAERENQIEDAKLRLAAANLVKSVESTLLQAGAKIHSTIFFVLPGGRKSVSQESPSHNGTKAVQVLKRTPLLTPK